MLHACGPAVRGADFLPEGSRFQDDRHATLGDVTHEVETRTGRRYICVLVQPAKKSEQHGTSEYVFLPEGDGITDAYTWVRAMLDMRS